MRIWKTGTLLLLLGTLGCNQARTKDSRQVGGDLPVTSSNSVALPGATDAADAPHAPTVAESSHADLTRFHDAATGVSFEYPNVWRPPVAGQSPAPEFAQVAGKPRATQQFYPEGTAFADTVLETVSFSYTVQNHNNESGCAALPGKSMPNASGSKGATYGGLEYTEVSGGDAAACTHVQAVLDTTLQGGKCYVFERDIVTTCPFVKSKTSPRPLTQQETGALQRELDVVMQSVKVNAK